MYYSYRNEVEVDALNGLVIKSIEGLKKESEEVRINTECGKEFVFYHSQDCCEDVVLYDFDCDFDLTGATILSSEKVESDTTPADVTLDYDEESETWTFYKIETSKGGIWMRWFGSSNGYYSEGVTLVWVNKP